MIGKSTFLGALVALLFAGAASAQDYGAMLNQALQQDRALTQRIRQAEAGVVQQVLRSPDFWAKYRQFRMAGGQLSEQQYAYQYAATGGFSAPGMARFRQSEISNQQGEIASWQRYRGAQMQRGAAQTNYAEGYFRNQRQAGDVLTGNAWYADPRSGQTYVLPYMGANGGYDPRTGQQFVRDGSGNYWASTAQGGWYQMYPTR